MLANTSGKNTNTEVAHVASDGPGASSCQTICCVYAPSCLQDSMLPPLVITTDTLTNLAYMDGNIIATYFQHFIIIKPWAVFVFTASGLTR